MFAVWVTVLEVLKKCVTVILSSNLFLVSLLVRIPVYESLTMCHLCIPSFNLYVIGVPVEKKSLFMIYYSDSLVLKHFSGTTIFFNSMHKNESLDTSDVFFVSHSVISRDQKS